MFGGIAHERAHIVDVERPGDCAGLLLSQPGVVIVFLFYIELTQIIESAIFIAGTKNT